MKFACDIRDTVDSVNALEVEKRFLLSGRWTGNILIPECRIQYQGGYCRADLLMISPAMRATEIEIKSSSADWENEKKKIKWRQPLSSFLWHFVYLVPEGLKTPEWISDVTGVWCIDRHGIIRVERQPKIISNHKVTAEELSGFLNDARFYNRYWSARLDYLNA